MAAVFLLEIFRNFSDDFQPVPARKHRKGTGIHRKKIQKISGENTAAFLQDPALFPRLFHGIRQPDDRPGQGLT
jgi:hypothetical protein